MPNDNMFPNWQPGVINAEFEPAANVPANIGDLAVWSSTGNVVQPASCTANFESTVLSQANVAAQFLGVYNSKRLSNDANVTLPGSGVRLLIDGIWEFPCVSATFAIGDYVGVNVAANVVENQKVVKVAQPQLAIGRVVKRYGSATTKVKCRIMSRYLLGLPDRIASDVGAVGQGVGVTALGGMDGDVTLTIDQGPIVTANSNGANRALTLPAAANCPGRVLYFTHDNGGCTANLVALKNASTVIANIPGCSTPKSAIAWCDGTAWRAILGTA